MTNLLKFLMTFVTDDDDDVDAVGLKNTLTDSFILHLAYIYTFAFDHLHY